MIINDAKMIRRRLVGTLFACSTALPALAEGGSYPSAGFLLGLLVVYALGIPIFIFAAAYAILKLFFKSKQPRKVVLFFAELLIWDAGLWLLVTYNPRLPFDEDQATLLGVVVLSVVTVLFGFWTGRPKPVEPS